MIEAQFLVTAICQLPVLDAIKALSHCLYSLGSEFTLAALRQRRLGGISLPTRFLLNLLRKQLAENFADISIDKLYICSFFLLFSLVSL